MAQLITRQDQAKRELKPKGWGWADRSGDREIAATPTLMAQQVPYHDVVRGYQYRTQKMWQWGRLRLERTLTLEARAESYKALIDMILANYVHVRVAAWNTTGNARMPTAVDVMPISASAFDSLADDYGVTNPTYEKVYDLVLKDADTVFNLRGWAMADGYVVGPGEITRDGKALACSRCHRVWPSLVTNPSAAGEHFCRRCIRVCPGTDQPCSVPVFDQNFTGCEAHFPRAKCSGCETVYEIARGMGEHNGVRYCLKCLNTICQRCDRVGAALPEYTIMDGHEKYVVCSECRKAVMEWLKQDRNEQIVLEKQPNMVLPNNASRPVRLCSVELEVVKGASKILADLYNKGLTANNECLRHWSNAPDFCYMEKDGSLPEYPAGGEIVFSKLRLDDATVAQKLAEAVGIIRKHVKNGDAAIDLRTGAHVHVDFHKSGFNHVRNLVVLHNFLEDVLYRLAAANYSRHRGTHYAIVLPKSGIDTQEEFNRFFFRRGTFEHMHHSVLNVDGYYRAAAECTCGHLVGETPEKCECQLGKCTVEFRVFNGTSSWRKLHAYVALCQSLVAYARAHDDLGSADFLPNLYNPVCVIGDSLKRAWIERLTWMFKNLWFSDEERESINYCIEHSDLASLSYAQRKALRDVKYVGEKYVSPRKSPAKPAPSPYQLSGRSRTQGSPVSLVDVLIRDQSRAYPQLLRNEQRAPGPRVSYR